MTKAYFRWLNCWIQCSSLHVKDLFYSSIGIIISPFSFTRGTHTRTTLHLVRRLIFDLSFNTEELVERMRRSGNGKLLLLLQFLISFFRSLVHLDELWSARSNVFLLCNSFSQMANSQMDRHVHYRPSDLSDGRWCYHRNIRLSYQGTLFRYPIEIGRKSCEWQNVAAERENSCPGRDTCFILASRQIGRGDGSRNQDVAIKDQR